MHMRALSTQQFYAAAGVDAGTFGARTNRQETALAFGIGQRLAGGKLLELDAVAMVLVDELAPAFSRRFAAGIVMGNAHAWLGAVGAADATREPIYFQVFESGEPIRSGDRSPLEKAQVGYSTLAEFEKNVKKATERGVGMPPRIHFYNITDILARVRANAARVGVDLSGPFFPAPDDPLAKQILDEATKDRDQALKLYFEQKMSAKADKAAPVQKGAQ